MIAPARIAPAARTALQDVLEALATHGPELSTEAIRHVMYVAGRGGLPNTVQDALTRCRRRGWVVSRRHVAPGCPAPGRPKHWATWRLTPAGQEEVARG